ncbi:MAG: chorismate-binding protein [Acidobacteria bacterium]|nr:chorismate-binding protein [Acidobacteriota bacterium]
MLERVVMTGVTTAKDIAKLVIQKVPDRPGVAAEFLGALAEVGINVNLIIQSNGEGNVAAIAMTVKKEYAQKAVEVPRREAYEVSSWEPRVAQAQYARAIQTIREYIDRGETYQTNYTFPLRCHFQGDSWSWYRELCAVQGAGYCAYVRLGRYHLLSLSPELSFERRGNTLTTRPMKGTMSRGRWLEEDHERAEQWGRDHL